MHDYNNIEFNGIKKSIIEAEDKLGTSICRFPLPDQGGTIVLSK